MPLLPSALEAALEAIASSPAPSSVEQAAAEWAQAMATYAAGIVPASTTIPAAATALQSALATAFTQRPAASSMETAFTAFAAAVGAGMAPAFVATPPPGNVGFAAQFGAGNLDSHAEAASQVAGIIDDWMKTGTAVPSAGGGEVDWS